MPRGGPRPGAGRPKGSKGGNTIAAEKLREFIIQKVREHVEPLMQAQLDLALGHKKLVKTKAGKELAYTISPDRNSIQYLLNQAIGKPRETVGVYSDVQLKLDI